jgi:2-polyprenyl-3-methyl-5-hydroxy-6-metoxy-1,4-benzoquinol methylase
VEALSQVDKLEIAARKREIEARYGPWTAHNLQLQDDLYTIRPGVAGGNEARVRRVLQLVADLAHGPIERLRILDLGALEGLFAVELARRGASVVALEGREANLEKMRLAKEALGLEHLELRQEDVRTLDPARHGEFDVVLCLGLLYHLDAPDIFLLFERMHEVCRDLVIIETRITPYPSAQYQHNGRPYWGVVTAEPPPDTPPHSRDALWSSIGNPYSFELTRASLCNALADVGYSSVLQCHLPPKEEGTVRATFAAFARPRVPILSVPELNEHAWERLSEPAIPLGLALRRLAAYRWLKGLVPQPARRLARRIGARLTRLREERQ